MASSRISLHRTAATVLAATMVLTVGGATVLAADPPTTTDPGAAAAGWIAGQLDDGVGPGNLADAIFAFAATGVGADAAAAALASLESGVDGYILDAGGTLVPGYLAKTLLAVQMAGGATDAFGGHDLEAELRGVMVTTPGVDLGRFGASMPSDQSLAILALSRTSGGIPAEALDWLISAQCSDGDFQWDASCPGAGAEDPDTTGLALQALLAGGASAAADLSTQMLLDIQGPDGAFSSFGTPNTNSSGMAGQALRAAGETAAADAAAAFILTLQYGCDARAADRGAYPWAGSYAGMLIYSTPQAVLAFGAPPLDELTMAGASAAAPVLECVDAEPTDAAPTGDPGAAPTITLPPTDLGAATTAGGGSPQPIAALLLLVSAGLAGIAVSRRVRRPR